MNTEKDKCGVFLTALQPCINCRITHRLGTFLFVLASGFAQGGIANWVDYVLDGGTAGVSSLETSAQSFLHRAWPKTRGPERYSRSALIVVAHVFRWPPVRSRNVRGGVGRRRSLISSPSGRLEAWPNQRSLLCTSSASILVGQRWQRSSTSATQFLCLTRRIRRMLSLSKTSNILSSASRTGHISQP